MKLERGKIYHTGTMVLKKRRFHENYSMSGRIEQFNCKAVSEHFMYRDAKQRRKSYSLGGWTFSEVDRKIAKKFYLMIRTEDFNRVYDAPY